MLFTTARITFVCLFLSYMTFVWSVTLLVVITRVMNFCVYYVHIRNIFIIHNSRELRRDDRVLSKNTGIGNSIYRLQESGCHSKADTVVAFTAFARSPADCTETLQTTPLKLQASSYWTTNNGVPTECHKGERLIRTHRVGVQMSSCDQMRTSPLGSTCGTPCNLLQVRLRFTSQTWNEIRKHTIFAWTHCQLWYFE